MTDIDVRYVQVVHLVLMRTGQRRFMSTLRYHSDQAEGSVISSEPTFLSTPETSAR